MRAFILSLSLAVTACTPGPATEFQLAHQGLLSGDISGNRDFSLIGSVHHGGSYWDIKRNERLYAWNHKNGEFSSFRTVALSKDGKVAVTTEEKSIGVWNTETGESKAFWEALDRILSIDLSEDGELALIGMRDGTLDLFNLRTGQVLQRMKHEAEIRSVAISQDGSIGISGSDDFSAKSWDLKSGEVLHTLSLSNQIKTVGLSPDATLAFTSAQREGALLWDPENGTTKQTIEARYTNYSSVEFDDSGKQLYLGTSAGLIEHWSIAKNEKLNTWQAKPRQAFGGASSKAIVALESGKGSVTALTADGMVQTFKP